MTTTPNPTAEQIIEDALRDSWSDELEYTDAPEAVTAALRAHGLLSEAAPGEEQIERAAIAIRNAQAGGASYKPVEMPVTPEHREIARAALTAAGVAPQGRSVQEYESKIADLVYENAELKKHLPAPSPDREKLKAWLQREFGSVLAHDPHNPERFWGGSADALCVAYTEGKLR